MNDIAPENFEQNQIESDIEKIGREVSEKRLAPEHKDYSERDIVKQTLHPIIQPQTPAPQVQQQKEDSALPNYTKDLPENIKVKVEKLLVTTFNHGIESAVREARQSADPFVLDAFHDALTDKMYDELKRRGFIK